jgi:hypothetical protein
LTAGAGFTARAAWIWTGKSRVVSIYALGRHGSNAMGILKGF